MVARRRKCPSCKGWITDGAKTCQDCRDTAYWAGLPKTYGITRDDFMRLYESQQGQCPICERPFPPRRLVVDHDHHTNVVRGLLCTGCNIGLGNLGDSIAGLRRALKYLERKPRQKRVFRLSLLASRREG